MKTIFLILITLLLSACASESAEMIQSVHHNVEGIYTVQKGDSLDSVAKKFDIPAKQIAFANNLFPPYRLYAGQKLRLSTAAQEINTPVHFKFLDWLKPKLRSSK